MADRTTIPKLGTGSIVSPDGRPLSNFQGWLNRAFSKLGTVVTDLATQLGLIETAQATADDAQTKAEAALATLTEYASDGLLTPVEKKLVIRQVGVIEDEQADLDAKADLYGVSRTAYDTAISALGTYLATLTSPTMWHDVSGNTTIVAATFTGKFADAINTGNLLRNAIFAAAKDGIETAQEAADAANVAAADAAAEAASATAELALIANDAILSRSEKRRVIREYQDILDAQVDDDDKADLYSIVIEKASYDDAITALTNYLATLTSPVAWNVQSGNTNIVAATWNSKWSDVYYSRVTLLNKIAVEAGLRATWANVRDSDPNSPDDNATRNVHRGTWAAGVAYIVGDLFDYGGSTYFVTTAHTSSGGSPPPNANVSLLAQAGIVGFLTNEAHTVATASDGSGGTYTGAGGTFKIFNGTTDVTTGGSVTFSVISSPAWISINSSGVYTVSNPGSDIATATLQAVYGGVTLQKVYTFAKSKAGVDGSNAKTLTVISDRQTISYDAAGSPSPSTQTTTFSTNKQNTSGTVTWSVTDAAGVARTPVTTYLSAGTGDSVTMTEAQFASARNGTSGVIVTGSITDGTTFTDKISVVRVQTGATGATGSTGATGATGATGPTLDISAPTGLFTMVDGVLTPSTQTIVVSALVNGTATSVSWAIKNPAGTDIRTATATTVSVTETDLGSNESLIIQATYSGVVARITLERKYTLSSGYLNTISYNRSNALDAGGTLLNVTSDGVLTRKEKKNTIVPEWARIQTAYTTYQAEALARGVTSEKTAHTTAYNALSTYLNTTTTVLVTTHATAVTLADFNAAFKAYYDAEEALVVACNSKASETATWVTVTGTGKPSDNATSDLKLNLSGSGLTITGNGYTCPSTVSAYTGAVYSSESYIEGFTLEAVYSGATGGSAADDLIGVGLVGGSLASGTGWLYAFNPSPLGPWYYYEAGTTATLATTIAAGDRLRIVGDGVNVYYFINNVLKRTVARTDNGSAFRAQAFSYKAGAGYTSISFTPSNRATWAAVGGTGKPADNATVGATWGSNVSSRPANLSALSGSENINNASIAVSSGAITGIGTGTGTVVANSSITVDGSGILQGIGTASKVVDNTKQLWTEVSGAAKPADYAGTSFVWESIGSTTVAVAGNSFVSTGAADFSNMVCGPAFTGTAFASVAFSWGGGTTYNQVILDDDATSTANANIKYRLQTQGTTWHLIIDGSSVSTSTNAALNSTAKTLMLAYDGTSVRGFIDGAALFTYTTGIAAGLTLWAKGFAYDTPARTVTDLQAGPFTDRAWTNIGGTGKPSDYATSDLRLTSIGSQAVVITGNSFGKTVAGDSHQSCVVGSPLDRGIYAECDIVSGAYYTVICLDDDATTVPNGTNMNLHVSYRSSTGSLDILRNSTTVHSVTISTGLTGKLAVAYDSVRYRVWVAGVERIPASGMTDTSGLTLWPKWTAYTSGSPTITGLKVTPFSHNDFAIIGGTTKPSDNADVTSAVVASTVAPAAQNVAYNANGTAKTGELSRTLTFIRKRGTTDVSQDNLTSWSISVAGCSATINNTNGSGVKGQVSLTAVASTGAYVQVTSTYNSLEPLVDKVMINKIVDQPSSGGGSGATGFDATIAGTVTDTAYTTPNVIATGTMRSNGSGQIIFTGSIYFNCGVYTANASTTLTAKVQKSLAGAGSWSDVTGMTSLTGGAATTDSYGMIGDTGVVPCSGTGTGFTASTDYDLRLVAYRAGSGTSVYPSGDFYGRQS